MKYFIRSLILGIAFGVAISSNSGSINALSVNNRSLTINSSMASANTSHIVRFNFQTTNSVGSLKFEYCTSPLQQLACATPTGLDASAATLASQSGETGFSIFSQDANTIVLSRAASVTGTQANSYRLNNVVNPSSIGAFYLRISSYASIDASGSALDFGGTVGSINQGVAITTEVPPTLNFCVGVNITGLCNTASGNFLSLGNFSTTKATTGTTKFLVGTNAGFGYVVKVTGNTLTSGNDVIPALASPTSSQVGSSQFGINLRANTNPVVGTNPSSGSGSPAPSYNAPNLFKFNSGDVLASNSSVADNERYTVSYIVNINGGQPIGVYNTTLTYTCTATF